MNYELLDQDIKYLPGVGPNRKKMLSNELGIETYGDLLEYYPYKYVDRSKVYTIHELTGDMPFVQVVGKILSFETFPMGPRKERVVAHFTDSQTAPPLQTSHGLTAANTPSRTTRSARSIWSSASPPSSTTASTSPTPTSTMQPRLTSRPWASSPTTIPARR